MRTHKNLITISKYYEIICQLIYESKIFSVVKLIFIAVSVYNAEDYYEGTTKKYNLIEDIVVGVRLCLNRNLDHFCYVFDCLNLLETAKMIEVKNGIIRTMSVVPKYEKNNKLLNSPQIKNSIAQVERISDEALIKEIIEYV